jgi:uncharacterized protein (UPF0548 family)
MRRFLETQAKLRFTYTDVGATATVPPPTHIVDHTRVELGSGAALFQKAQKALTQWKHFELGWMHAWPTDTPIRAEETVGVVVRAAGFWWLNAARIVYVVDESDKAATKFGFAYGTLPGHVESGEERFLVEWDHRDDRVYYDIVAFSRPRHFLTRLAKRRVRKLQKRFGQESAAAMKRAVGG